MGARICMSKVELLRYSLLTALRTRNQATVLKLMQVTKRIMALPEYQAFLWIAWPII